MQITHVDAQKEYLCHCSCTTPAQVINLVRNGANTLEQISHMTGAAAGCGACETWIMKLLAELVE